MEIYRKQNNTNQQIKFIITTYYRREGVSQKLK